MSQFKFLASKVALDLVSNDKIKGYKLAPGAKMSMEDDGKIVAVAAVKGEDPYVVCEADEVPTMIKVGSEEDFGELTVSEAAHYEHAYYGDECHHFYDVNIEPNEARHAVFIDYMEQQLRYTDYIELWSYWENNRPYDGIVDYDEKELKTIDLKYLKKILEVHDYRCLRIKEKIQLVFDEVLSSLEENDYREKVKRKAVRGIAVREGKVLMIHSKEGRYQFPGGGIEAGESNVETLRREMAEETGYKCFEVSPLVGRVMECKTDMYEPSKKFEMVSSFYLCQVSQEAYEPKLENYEKELGYVAVWMDPEEALKKNRSFLTKLDRPDLWTRRTNIVLESIPALRKSSYGKWC